MVRKGREGREGAGRRGLSETVLFSQVFCEPKTDRSEVRRGFPGLNSRCGQAPAPSGGAKGESMSWLLQLREAPTLLSSWSLPPSPKPAVSGHIILVFSAAPRFYF